LHGSGNRIRPSISFISVIADPSLARAAALDAIPVTSAASYPLFGVCVAVKDNICTEGAITTCGSRMLQTFVPPYTPRWLTLLSMPERSSSARRNLDEFAMGSSTKFLFSDPRKTRTTRVASRAAQAAAAPPPSPQGWFRWPWGRTPADPFRQPCSHCGVLRTQAHVLRVSRYGLVAFASSLDQIGPIATDVQDLGLLLSVISVPDKRDSTCAGKQFIDSPDLYNGNISGLTVGVPKEYFAEGLSAGVEASIKNVMAALLGAGCRLRRRFPAQPRVRHSRPIIIVCTAEASSNLARYERRQVRLPERRQTLRKPRCSTCTGLRARGIWLGSQAPHHAGTYVLSSGYYDAY